MRGSSKSKTPAWPTHALALGDGRCRLERSHQVPSHEEHTGVSSDAIASDQHVRWVPVPGNDCLSRAGDKPGLITSHSLTSVFPTSLKGCWTLASCSCSDIAEHSLQNTWKVTLFMACQAAPCASELWMHLEGHRMYFFRRKKAIYTWGTISWAPALCNWAISIPPLPTSSVWAADSAFVKKHPHRADPKIKKPSLWYFSFIAPNYCKLWRSRAAKLAIKLSALSCLNRTSPGFLAASTTMGQHPGRKTFLRKPWRLSTKVVAWKHWDWWEWQKAVHWIL